MKKTRDKRWHMLALQQAIDAVCPNVGFSDTGRIDFKPEATEQQRRKAQAIFAGWDWEAEVGRPLTLREEIDALKERVADLERQLLGE